MSHFHNRWSAGAVALSAGLLLAGCGGPDHDRSTATEADAVTVSDQWVKAADSGMSAAFAQLANTGSGAVRIVSVSSPASTRMELHEIAAGADGATVMREKPGGVTIPAGSTHPLAPGGDHLMLMDLTAPLTPGATTTFTLTFEDGSATTFDAQVRDFSGNQENYDPAGGHDTTPAAVTAPRHGG
ncbi:MULTISPECIES: copper chaperone PCu(A)C [unclassified Rhodococcus (in: high G+C Gram-positive bacteria)]|uniref:copper chaperone PCu(A)C n=1 Tax=unclassified Rhodococcus (in: high G+C Gram-positive bacteria) TaxID=192944 RepID=UPI00163A0E1E|nr:MULTISPECIES: copper chaperone PCu(A)C [unclassified Rhodococcus (in: high G+C Gram-positive bacteria)]MBC2637765.1 copper chaperone PCu(A)C [Rhodococcus sp. 3A]MBC2897490.1 copper chaperone PCu(A)C [Rhodococcus sp. 4CII]